MPTPREDLRQERWVSVESLLKVIDELTILRYEGAFLFSDIKREDILKLLGEQK